jgi:uncharacterized protein YjbJ (UPF0337 family)
MDSAQKRSADALDNCRFAIDPVAVGDGQLVHTGWIHSHSARPGSDSGFDPGNPGTQPRALADVEPDCLAGKSNRETKGGNTDMNKDQVEGKVKDIAGRVERQAGEWTGDKEKQVHGTVKQVEGKVQNTWGDAKDSVDKKTAGKTTEQPERSTDEQEEKEEDVIQRRKVS